MTTNDFPFIEEYTDCAGKKHVFVIEAHEVPTGWSVRATEKQGKSKTHGYEFSCFSPVNPYLALGEIRGKIRQNLAIKYLDTSSEYLSLTHERMTGLIVYDPDTQSHGVLVDGRFLSMEELEQILSQYEGWEFSLAIHES